MNVPIVFSYLNSVRMSYDHKCLLQARSNKETYRERATVLRCELDLENTPYEWQYGCPAAIHYS